MELTTFILKLANLPGDSLAKKVMANLTNDFFGLLAN
jgi:hypothetical protein